MNNQSKTGTYQQKKMQCLTEAFTKLSNGLLNESTKSHSKHHSAVFTGYSRWQHKSNIL